MNTIWVTAWINDISFTSIRFSKYVLCDGADADGAAWLPIKQV